MNSLSMVRSMSHIDATADWYAKLYEALLKRGIDGKTAQKILVEEGKRRKDKQEETDIKKMVKDIAKGMK